MVMAMCIYLADRSDLRIGRRKVLELLKVYVCVL